MSQPIVNTGTGCCCYCKGLRGRKLHYHISSLFTVGSFCPRENVSSPQNKPYQRFIHLLFLNSLREISFECIETFGLIERGCAPPHSTPNPRMGTPCALSWSPVVMSCSRALTDPPQEATISFPSGIQVCLHGSEGGGHCLQTSAVLCSPPRFLHSRVEWMVCGVADWRWEPYRSLEIG